MSHFQQTPAFTGVNKPSGLEADIADLVHEGDLPRDLSGAFYRVRPDPQFPSRLGDEIATNGDGAIVQACNRLEDHRGDIPLIGAVEIEKGSIGPIRISIRWCCGLYGNGADAAGIGWAA